jgi:hypothetical protein
LSKPDDKTLCIGDLGLDISPLLQCREAERVKAFFSLLDTILPDMIFVPGPKIQVTGYRWALTSLMNAINKPYRRCSGQLTPQNLHICIQEDCLPHCPV